MARNRIAMSLALFGRLTDYAAQAGDPVANPDAGRWITRKDGEDAFLIWLRRPAAAIHHPQERRLNPRHSFQLEGW